MVHKDYEWYGDEDNDSSVLYYHLRDHYAYGVMELFVIFSGEPDTAYVYLSHYHEWADYYTTVYSWELDDMKWKALTGEGLNRAINLKAYNKYAFTMDADSNPFL